MLCMPKQPAGLTCSRRFPPHHVDRLSLTCHYLNLALEAADWRTGVFAVSVGHAPTQSLSEARRTCTSGRCLFSLVTNIFSIQEIRHLSGTLLDDFAGCGQFHMRISCVGHQQGDGGFSHTPPHAHIT